MTRFAISMGSNLGDRVGHLRGAVDEIGRLGHVDAVAGLYETAPVGGPEQGPYLNSVLVLDTGLEPFELLKGLNGIESSHGRERLQRWGPRTLDLDIVSSDGPPFKTPALEVPHPRARERRFVLQPLSEVWPDAPVGGGQTATSALIGVSDQPVDLLDPGWVEPDRQPPGRYWVMAQVALMAAIGVALVWQGSFPSGGPEAYRVLGIALLLLGGALVLISARVLGSALIPLPEPKPGASMVDDGVYRFARHPIYGGLTLLFLGLSLAFSSVLAGVLTVALFVVLWLKSRYEERLLRIAYPDYSSYRRRVRKRMVPFLV